MKKYYAGGLFLIVILFYAVILKPTTKGSNNENLQVPDISIGYSGEELYQSFFSKIDLDQISSYKTMMLWDFAYPIVYTVFLILMGQILFSKGLFRKLFFVAVYLAFIFDYAENFTIIHLLNELPETHLQVGDMLGVFTLIKWIMAGFTLLSVLVGIIRSGAIKILTAN